MTQKKGPFTLLVEKTLEEVGAHSVTTHRYDNKVSHPTYFDEMADMVPAITPEWASYQDMVKVNAEGVLNVTDKAALVSFVDDKESYTEWIPLIAMGLEDKKDVWIAKKLLQKKGLHRFIAS